jgi:hypothetical protein
MRNSLIRIKTARIQSVPVIEIHRTTWKTCEKVNERQVGRIRRTQVATCFGILLNKLINTEFWPRVEPDTTVNEQKISFLVTDKMRFVCKCVLHYCHRLSTQLQLNIPSFIIVTCEAKTRRFKKRSEFRNIYGGLRRWLVPMNVTRRRVDWYMDA